MAKKKPEDVSNPPAAAAPPELPPGVKLVRTLRGHTDTIGRIAWSPDGRVLASPSDDATIRLWDVETSKCLAIFGDKKGGISSVAFDGQGRLLASGGPGPAVNLWEVTTRQLIRRYEGHKEQVTSVAFDPKGQVLASASDDRKIRLWDVASGRLLHTLEGHTHIVTCVTFDPKGETLASGSWDTTVKIWESNTGRLITTLKGHQGSVYSVAFHPAGVALATGSSDDTIKWWEVSSGRTCRTLEGHTGRGIHVAFSPGGEILASKGSDGTIRLWNCDSGVNVAIMRGAPSIGYSPGFAFHPRDPLLATVGSLDDSPKTECDRIIQLLEFDLDVLTGRRLIPQSSHYVNAKVVLLGDTGVGKSGLGLVLNLKPFAATDSTPGRHVWTLKSEDVEIDEHRKQTRETLLWDLAGQPGYRVIHQLYLSEVAVALVVFDARSEIDPLAGVRHWERALRLAQQRQGASCVPLKKFLVSARTDRGTLSLSKERLDALVKEFSFDGYFETSAKEGWQIKELRQAIEQAIPWGELPEVSSSVLFADIKAFLLEVKQTGKLIALASELNEDYARAHPDVVAKEANLRDQFETCIGRLENRDLIRRLSFGGYVLLQPELLDAYASAMVNAAKKEPDGLGSIAEDAALAGQFYVPDEQKIKDRGQEQLLLHATVEELVRHDLALRESATDGRYLVFPSEFIRDYEAAPEPKGKAVALTFDGPVQSLYSTLAVRLGHSGLFTTGRAEMWRNAAVFKASAGGKCGLYLHEFQEARGRLVIFYEQHEGKSPSDETRFHFEEFVLAHAQRKSLDGSVELVRFFACPNCREPVPDAYVKMCRNKGLKDFECPCGGKVSLAEPKENLQFTSKVEAMELAADRERRFESFIESARGETSTPSFMDWAGGNRVTLAIVFTDVIGSTVLGQDLRDEDMNHIRRTHFGQCRKLISKYKGIEIKTIGDGTMAAFRDAAQALKFLRALKRRPGDSSIRLRGAIHVGPMQVEQNDVFGGAVNFAARLLGAIEKDEIWLSDRAKQDVETLEPRAKGTLSWKARDGVTLKGLAGTIRIWRLVGQASTPSDQIQKS